MKKSEFFISHNYSFRHSSPFLNHERSKSFNNNVDLRSFKDENNNMLYSPAPVCQKYSRKIFKKKTVSKFIENESQDEILSLQSINLPEPPSLKDEEINHKIFERSLLDLTNSNSKINIKRLGRKRKKNEKINNAYNKDIYIEIQGTKIKILLDIGNHSKFSEDNMMRKIKVYFLNYCQNLINKSIKDKNFQFLKIGCDLSECLRKDFNLD